MNENSPIGVFDSGLGGISVLSTIHTLLPHENLIFFGDSKYNPYGTKSKEEITERCISICDWFMEQDVKAIVIACNTATSACVPLLREKYPIDIIGMEPALKVACDRGPKQKIAVWATDFTLREQKFARLMHRFESEHTISKVPCPKLVRLVEEDHLDDKQRVQDVLNEYLAQSKGVDSIVLGCTHFIFYKEYLEQLSDALLIDGNVGTVNHLTDLLERKDLLSSTNQGEIMWENTDPSKLDLSKSLLERMNILWK